MEKVHTPRLGPNVCSPPPHRCDKTGYSLKDVLDGIQSAPCTAADRRAWLAAEAKRENACERAKKAERLKREKKALRWKLRGKGNQLPLNELKARLSQTRDKDCPWYHVRIDMGDPSQSIGGLVSVMDVLYATIPRPLTLTLR